MRSDGNVAGNIVGIGIDPEPRGIEFLFQSQRIIHHHFAGEEHHGQFVAKTPRLHPVGDLRLQFFAAIQTVEIFSGVITDGRVFSWPGSSHSSRVGGLSNGSSIFFGAAIKFAAERSRRYESGMIHGVGEFLAVLFGKIQARRGLGLASAPQPMAVSTIAPG